jgi:hypothetical protein
VNSLSRIPQSLAELPPDGNPLLYCFSTNSCSEPVFVTTTQSVPDQHGNRTVPSQPKNDGQVRSEVLNLISPLVVKFNFEERSRSFTT